MDAGQQLFEARQRRGLTLDDISRTTKIPVSVLDAIERNDETRLPQRFFTRAFVRTYAAEVGLNADELLDDHDVEQLDYPPASGIGEEPASSRSFLLAAAAAAFTIYYGSSLQQASPSIVQAVEAPIVQPAGTGAAADRGDITLPAEALEPEPIVPPRPVVQRVRHEPVTESIAAIFDSLPASAVEPAPALADAVLPEPEPTTVPLPVEQF